jgi:hypothetical protein
VIKTICVIARPLLLFQEERQTAFFFFKEHPSTLFQTEINNVVFSAITIKNERAGFIIYNGGKNFVWNQWAR